MHTVIETVWLNLDVGSGTSMGLLDRFFYVGFTLSMEEGAVWL